MFLTICFYLVVDHYDENKKNADIEILRAFAIIFTLIHHTAFFLLPRPNFLIDQLYHNFTFWGGVDLFFAISGFVIYRSLRKSFNFSLSAKSNLPIVYSFWIKRAFRIFPSAWLWALVYLVVSYNLNFINAFGSFEINLEDSISWFFQFANFHQYLCAQGLQKCGYNGVYWSLSLEEQFYIVLPILLLIFRKNFYIPMLFLFLVQFLQNRPEWSLGWAFRSDAMILGILIGILKEKSSFSKLDPKFLNSHPLRMLLISGILIAIGFVPNENHNIPLATSILTMLVASLVFIASFDRDYLVRTRIMKNIFLWIGSRSYSIYLIHIVCFRAAYEIIFAFDSTVRFTKEDHWLLIAVAYSSMTLFTILNFKYIEEPLRKFGRKISEKMIK